MCLLGHMRAGVGGGAWWGRNSSGAPSMARGTTAGQGGAVLTHRDNGRMPKTETRQWTRG